MPVYSGLEKIDVSKPLTWLAKLGLPVVEVGCGDGAYIHWMNTYYGTHVIGVDPRPGSYGGLPVIRQPEFEIVADLVFKRPELIGECALLIIRPYPDGYHAKNRLPYDIEAVNLLKPKVMIFIYHSDGADGSSKLHDFLHVNGCPSKRYVEPFNDNIKVLTPEQREYNVWSTKYTDVVGFPSEIAIPTCSVLVRKNGIEMEDNWPPFEQNPKAPNQETARRLFLRSLECSIQ